MKVFFGGSAAIAGALLLSSFLIFVPTSIAEPLQQPEKAQNSVAEQKKKENTFEQVKLSDSVLAAKELKDGAEIAEAVPVEKAAPVAVITANTTENQPAAAPATFTATAYSLYGRTASGSGVRKGIVAADRSVLPIGTKVRIEAGSYTGEYEVCDTGGAVHGKRIDVWVPSSREAMRFGRRHVKLTVLSYPKRATAATRRAQHN
jgi:3D (Asp-Asp-Asp) domain-containing protein